MSLSDSPSPRTLPASQQPCQLYKSHSPWPCRVQGHHRHPVYLQNRVYGHIQDSELLWLCGTCHDNVHEWLSWLLREARKPSPEPGAYAKREAQRSYLWYVEGMRAKDPAFEPPRPVAS